LSEITEKPAQQDETHNHLLLDQLPRLTLFAEGIIGQTFHVLPQDDESLVVPGASQRTIRLPGRLPGQLSHHTSESVSSGAWRAMILQQLAPLLFGTLDFQLPDRAPLREESGEIHGDLQVFFNTTTHPGLTRRLFYGCESIRVDERIRSEYPGIVNHLERLNSNRLDQAAIDGLHNDQGDISAVLPPLVELIFEALLVLECNPTGQVFRCTGEHCALAGTRCELAGSYFERVRLRRTHASAARCARSCRERR